MSDSNGNKPSTSACPYCANPNLFDEALAVATEESEDSKFTLDPISDKALAERYAGFRIEIIGTKVTDDDSPSPPGPFLRKAQRAFLQVQPSHDTDQKENESAPLPIEPSVQKPNHVTLQVHDSLVRTSSGGVDVNQREGNGSPKSKSYWRLFNACRITRKDSKIVVDVHWWPDHGRKITISNMTPVGASAKDLEVISQAIKFFREETRGQGKITEEKLRKALSSLGPTATQNAAAKTLKVSESALEQWRRRQHILNWQEVVQRFATP